MRIAASVRASKSIVAFVASTALKARSGGGRVVDIVGATVMVRKPIQIVLQDD